MNRQDALNIVWRKLLIIFIVLLALSIILSLMAGSYTVPVLTFIIGNIGGYVGIHRSLSALTDTEVDQLSKSWLGLVVPSFVGGILACVLYILFISGIISGELFPEIVEDAVKEGATKPEGFEDIFHQHAKGFSEYAKLFFWAFVAGFNQKYVVDVIDSIKSRQ
ncbi:hypothetical protein [Methylobacter sp. YRD-M1]|uniref:hypothetical protein n=1 Tax=Methylobacter sp. YRD-M1 TaxID=2911520 RepID=UPI00227CCACD|nr:hypothetical protein [Methylobacter sp. YRD-M1]WAK01351.1 hypothetical protein LZ558_16180 [Methylobacter sp. YRD-M1]